MVKPALGKGMKDLLAKNIILGEQEQPADARSASEELKINIQRYQAQEFDVSLLEGLRGRSPDVIAKGIEDYREAVKKLISAQTIIRSLEGYGYNDELERILEGIKDPSRADQVLASGEELRDRAMTEHNLKKDKKEAPHAKLSEALKVQSEKLNKSTPEPALEEMDLASLDSMLADLNEIGDAFTQREDGTDPIMDEIRSWEEEGYFIDRLVALLQEDRDAAIEEMKTFEQGILEMRIQKERFRKMDLSAFGKQAQSISIKFQYPHMASEIKNELDAIEKKIEDELREAARRDEAVSLEPVPKTPVEEEASVEESPSEVPPEGGSAVLEEEPALEAPEAPSEVEPAPAAEPEDKGLHPEMDVDQLLERAKELYRNGEIESSMECFQEIIRRDPENSKARFMIRRLSTKQ